MTSFDLPARQFAVTSSSANIASSAISIEDGGTFRNLTSARTQPGTVAEPSSARGTLIALGPQRPLEQLRRALTIGYKVGTPLKAPDGRSAGEIAITGKIAPNASGAGYSLREPNLKASFKFGEAEAVLSRVPGSGRVLEMLQGIRREGGQNDAAKYLMANAEVGVEMPFSTPFLATGKMAEIVGEVAGGGSLADMGSTLAAAAGQAGGALSFYVQIAKKFADGAQLKFKVGASGAKGPGVSISFAAPGMTLPGGKKGEVSVGLDAVKLFQSPSDPKQLVVKTSGGQLVELPPGEYGDLLRLARLAGVETGSTRDFGGATPIPWESVRNEPTRLAADVTGLAQNDIAQIGELGFKALETANNAGGTVALTRMARNNPMLATAGLFLEFLAANERDRDYFRDGLTTQGLLELTRKKPTLGGLGVGWENYGERAVGAMVQHGLPLRPVYEALKDVAEGRNADLASYRDAARSLLDIPVIRAAGGESVSQAEMTQWVRRLNIPLRGSALDSIVAEGEKVRAERPAQARADQPSALSVASQQSDPLPVRRESHGYAGVPGMGQVEIRRNPATGEFSAHGRNDAQQPLKGAATLDQARERARELVRHGGIARENLFPLQGYDGTRIATMPTQQPNRVGQGHAGVPGIGQVEIRYDTRSGVFSAHGSNGAQQPLKDATTLEQARERARELIRHGGIARQNLLPL